MLVLPVSVEQGISGGVTCARKSALGTVCGELCVADVFKWVLPAAKPAIGRRTFAGGFFFRSEG